MRFEELVNEKLWTLKCWNKKWVLVQHVSANLTDSLGKDNQQLFEYYMYDYM